MQSGDTCDPLDKTVTSGAKKDSLDRSGIGIPLGIIPFGITDLPSRQLIKASSYMYIMHISLSWEIMLPIASCGERDPKSGIATYTGILAYSTRLRILSGRPINIDRIYASIMHDIYYLHFIFSGSEKDLNWLAEEMETIMGLEGYPKGQKHTAPLPFAEFQKIRKAIIKGEITLDDLYPLEITHDTRIKASWSLCRIRKPSRYM